tara:strand:+ start:226 stop:579 length:354 start_codon:yes stop_codon:yes gene_type:complete
MYSLLTKKDIIAFNQEIGEMGEFNNESSLDFALSIVKTKKNWIYELSYLVRSLLVDHVFQDGNKRTCFLIMIYYLETNRKEVNKYQINGLIKKIAKNNITKPLLIAEMIYHATKKED